MLTIITPTGERPEAFELCQRQMMRQTYSGAVRWIVIDDGEVPSSISFQRPHWTIEILRPEPFWSPGDNTQGRNLNLALDVADRESVLVFVEDDDWYSPKWLETVASESKAAELVGEGDAIYFNARYRKAGRLRNYKHASLRCSAIRDGAIDTFRKVLGRGSKYYDFDLWKAHDNKRVFFTKLTVGIKGLPGRPGIAVGHSPEWGTDDPRLEKLRERIGNDTDLYAKFYEEPVMTEKQTKKMRALVDFKYGERGMIRAGDIFSLRSDREESLFIACGRAAPCDKNEPPRKQRASRSLKVETQEQKLDDAVIEKAPEPAAPEESLVEPPLAETEPEMADRRRYSARKSRSLDADQ